MAEGIVLPDNKADEPEEGKQEAEAEGPSMDGPIIHRRELWKGDCQIFQNEVISGDPDPDRWPPFYAYVAHPRIKMVSVNQQTGQQVEKHPSMNVRIDADTPEEAFEKAPEVVENALGQLEEAARKQAREQNLQASAIHARQLADAQRMKSPRTGKGRRKGRR